MTSVAVDRPNEAIGDELPDDVFDGLVPHGKPVGLAANAAPSMADLLALPELPSLKGYESRLTGI